MRIIRTFAAVAISACASVGLAGPAAADNPPPHPQVLEGAYDYIENGKKIGTWEIYPTCVPTVGDLREPLYIPVGCTLHVAPSEDVTGGNAVMTSGVWQFSTPKRKGIQCPDGSWEQVTETIKFDPIALTGTRKVLTTANPECNLRPSMTDFPFTLVRSGQLPIPVDRYPLICEPGGLRRCF
ncbi:hypothetical protein N4S67_17990 [Mycobacterium sp. CPCC 205710]|uniref:Secreted protein n=1 Tax=Mycobacterium deserti TaxID=2978347 RepID=A0ABT2MDH0_9MYCO|nr:hypothetical protein [Mycobacterium deserti]